MGVVVVVIGTLVVIGIPLSEGWKHQRIAATLDKNTNANVRFTHYKIKPCLCGTSPFVRESTLPDWIEKCGMSPIWRRVKSVAIPQIYFDALPQISKLKSLDQLYIRGNVTGEKVRLQDEKYLELISSIDVRELGISYLKLSEAPRSWLNNESVIRLDVAGPWFSNSEIDHLPKSLESFSGSNTQIDHIGLEKFLRLRNLKKLVLSNSTISNSDRDEFRKKMPWCDIQIHSSSRFGLVQE